MTAVWPAMAMAVCAAAAFGTSGALQHRVARRTARRPGSRFGVVRSLAREPVWLASLALNGTGVVLHWIALSRASVALVQPVLVLDLLFAVLGASMLRRHWPDRIVVLGALLCAGGLAAFLVLAEPVPGHSVPGTGETLLVGGCVLAVVAACLAVAARFPGTARTLSLASATGVLFGVTAGIAKLATDDLDGGLAAMLTHWPVYAVIVCATCAFVLSQYAFRAGVAVAPALGVMVVLNPLAGIAVGALWLGERINAGPGALAGEVFALGFTAAGIAVLAKRAPAAERRPEITPERRTSAEPGAVGVHE
ncbi:DMT family transporter [Amycolatopsis magusensis]|uniref:Drug/metabolite transporter (DMT)-like permease n=1 Tax=Amycolatopsis magusensis TaxID=882444 RepID=A0ABS4Q1S2_9PSEU|nr:DMT family transporter [Amycolatopsis magusensis]MBP2185629.1 drug/metabolite transporter (DMT)-like permease [Amycolatopsis magusensis]